MFGRKWEGGNHTKLQCTYCGGTNFREGPSGGMSTNVLCANKDCRHWFNWTPEIRRLDDLKRVEPTEEERAADTAKTRTAAGEQTKNRWNEGRMFYQDHLSTLSLLSDPTYGPIAENRANIERICGFLDAISEDIRTIQERDLMPTAVFVKPDTLEHRAADGTLLGRIPAYGPGSITDAATYEAPLGPTFRPLKPVPVPISHEFRMEHDPQYREGWNAAIDHILKISGKWMYHTGREEPPYHLPCIDDEKRRELLMLKRE